MARSKDKNPIWLQNNKNNAENLADSRIFRKFVALYII